MKKSSRHSRIISEVCRALLQGAFPRVPTKEEFLEKFAPDLLKKYFPQAPIGGIRINKHGRPVSWGTKVSIKSQNTKRNNEAERIYAECAAIIQSELSRESK